MIVRPEESGRIGLLAAAMVALALVLAATASVAVRRLVAAPPVPAVQLRAPATLMPVPAGAAAVTPAQGSVALSVGSARLAGGSTMRVVEQDAARVRQIGSVAKVMTALVTLDRRPLAAGESGPRYTIDAVDVALYRQDLAAGGSVAPVSEGEVFTERQLLLALLLPSGNNVAETIARWVGGSRDGFVAMLNARAQQLGMHATHFADPSGFDDGTVASADDLVTLGTAALGRPALAELVATRSATLPDGTPIANLDSLLGTEPGWLGIKTGSTNSAGGCLLFAARRTPAGAPPGDAADSLLMVGAVLGQPRLTDALSAAAAVVNSVAPQFQLVDPASLRPGITGTVTAAWGSASAAQLGVAADGTPMVLRAGQVLTLAVTDVPAPAPLAGGASVGTLTATSGGAVVVTWSVVTERGIDPPGVGWRLSNG